MRPISKSTKPTKVLITSTSCNVSIPDLGLTIAANVPTEVAPEIVERLRYVEGLVIQPISTSLF